MSADEGTAEALMRVYHFTPSKLEETIKNTELTNKLLSLAREVRERNGRFIIFFSPSILHSKFDF